MSTAKAAALALVLMFLAPGSVFARDYIAEAEQALEQAPVFVVPGTEGTDKYTADKLRARLTEGDNIVLVMFPSQASTELGSDTTAVAARLSEDLGNRRIIGLAVGKKIVGYGSVLPSGVAADQMRRAESVSNDPVTALGTFVQNVHIWQAEHPQPKPTPTVVSSKGGSDDGLWWFLFPIILMGLGVLVAVIGTGALQSTQGLGGNFRVPGQVRDLLVRILLDRSRVYDPDLSESLAQLCTDIDRYFRSSSKDKKADADFLRDRLNEAVQVLDKYIDVQENPRYYNKPRDLLDKGKEALLAFCQYVLDSIRRGNEADLVDFRVNADILKEHRRMASPEEDFDRALNDRNHKGGV